MNKLIVGLVMTTKITESWPLSCLFVSSVGWVLGLAPVPLLSNEWVRNASDLKVVLCQVNIFCHQLTQNMTTDVGRFTKITQIVLNLKTQVLQVLNFRTIQFG